MDMSDNKSKKLRIGGMFLNAAGMGMLIPGMLFHMTVPDLSNGHERDQLKARCIREQGLTGAPACEQQVREQMKHFWAYVDLSMLGGAALAGAGGAMMLAARRKRPGNPAP
jgi:hypothetical protein